MGFLPSMVSKNNTGGSIWDQIVGTAKEQVGNVVDAGKKQLNDVARSAITGAAEEAKGYIYDQGQDLVRNILPNWAPAKFFEQQTDPLDRSTYKPDKALRVNLQDVASTGQPPAKPASVQSVPSGVQPAAFDIKPQFTMFSGSSNAAVYIIVSAILGYVILRTYL